MGATARVLATTSGIQMATVTKSRIQMITAPLRGAAVAGVAGSGDGASSSPTPGGSSDDGLGCEWICWE